MTVPLETPAGPVKMPGHPAYPAHTDALRDRFAEAALVGILSNPNARVVDPRDAAKLAYQYAESMLLERRR